jgi:hypothetical protein
MNCCCPESDQPHEVYVSHLSYTRAPSQKQKFSFRTTADCSPHDSRVSQASSYRPDDHELEALEREYRHLKEEEDIINQFERNRLIPLEEEVTFYEREIQLRSQEIRELDHLLRTRIEQKRQQPAHYHPANIVYQQSPDPASLRTLPQSQM